MRIRRHANGQTELHVVGVNPVHTGGQNGLREIFRTAERNIPGESVNLFWNIQNIGQKKKSGKKIEIFTKKVKFLQKFLKFFTKNFEIFTKIF